MRLLACIVIVSMSPLAAGATLIGDSVSASSDPTRFLLTLDPLFVPGTAIVGGGTEFSASVRPSAPIDITLDVDATRITATVTLSALPCDPASCPLGFAVTTPTFGVIVSDLDWSGAPGGALAGGVQTVATGGGPFGGSPLGIDAVTAHSVTFVFQGFTTPFFPDPDAPFVFYSGTAVVELTPVPEPSASGLLVLGLAWVGHRVRRRTR